MEDINILYTLRTRMYKYKELAKESIFSSNKGENRKKLKEWRKANSSVGRGPKLHSVFFEKNELCLPRRHNSLRKNNRE